MPVPSIRQSGEHLHAAARLLVGLLDDGAQHEAGAFDDRQARVLEQAVENLHTRRPMISKRTKGE